MNLRVCWLSMLVFVGIACDSKVTPGPVSQNQKPQEQSLEGRSFGDLVMNPNDELPLHAIRITPTTQPPAHGIVVGAKKDHYIIPLQGRPEEFLEAGDLVIFFDDFDPSLSSLAQIYARGANHIAIAARTADGKLLMVHSPSSFISSTIDLSLYPSYHVLRLRKTAPVLPESKEAAAQMMSNWPPTAEEVIAKGNPQEFAAWRSQSISNMNRHALALAKLKSPYDNRRITELNINADLRLSILTSIDSGNVCVGESTWSTYCSELAASPSIAEGFREPLDAIFGTYVRYIEPSIQAEMRRLGTEDRSKAVAHVVESIMSQRDMLILNGASDDVINGWELDHDISKFPVIEKGYKPMFNALLNILPTDSEGRIALLKQLAQKPSPMGKLIGVPHYKDALYRPGNPFEYVGTYVQNEFLKQTPPTITGQQLSKASHEDRNSHFVESVFMHTFPVDVLAVTADGSKVVTSSADELIRIYDIYSRRTTTISIPLMRVKSLVTYGNDIVEATVHSVKTDQDETLRFSLDTGVQIPGTDKLDRPAYNGIIPVSGQDRTLVVGSEKLNHFRRVVSASQSADGSTVVSGSGESIHIYFMK